MSTRISERQRLFSHLLPRRRPGPSIGPLATGPRPSPGKRSLISCAILLLAACGQSETDEQTSAPVALNQQSPDAAVNQILCAPEGATDFTRTCTIERTGDTFTVRNPDGGFHRLVTTSDGGVAAADGAEPAQVTERGPDTIEVTIGADRYRVPATP